MNRSNSFEYQFLRIFSVPLLIAFISIIGLSAALLGDDYWDWLSWLLLGGVALAATAQVLISFRAKKR